MEITEYPRAEKAWPLQLSVENKIRNTVAMCDSYPISRMDACIDTLGDTNIFSKLELSRGYWQVGNGKRMIEKAGFAYAHGLFQLLCLQCLSKNISGTFQWTMEFVLSTFRW